MPMKSDILLINNIFFGIHRNAVEFNLIMHMGPCTAAGIAHGGNLFPALDFFASFLQKLIAVGKTGDHSVAVVDDNHVAQQTFATDKGHHSVRSRQYRRSFFGGNIKTLVKLAPSRERRNPISEFGRRPPSDRSDGRG